MTNVINGIKYSSSQIPNKLIFKESPLCEVPLSIDCSSHFDIGTIGAFTFFRANGVFKNVESIGRFCSIAPNCIFGPEEHHMDFLTTSTILNSKSQWGFSDEFSVFWDIHFNELKVVRQKLKNCNFKNNKKIKIGNDVWVGQNVTILRGVSVGDGAIIGANSLVTKDVPPYTVCAGVPARIIKNRFDSDTIELLMRAKWWEYDLSSLSGIVFSDAAKAAKSIIDNSVEYKQAKYRVVNIR